MTPSAFSRLYEASADPVRLAAVYDGILSELFRNPFWEGGSIPLRRVLWTRGEQARTEDMETFASPGLYVWGAEDRPLYVGITRRSFRKRFRRYIGHEKSQCDFAQQLGPALISKGLDGFPPEIIEWYGQRYPGSKVRLNGAVRFANEGIEKVWFALFPHVTAGEIRTLERALIPVAEEWNVRHGLRPLLNKQK